MVTKSNMTESKEKEIEKLYLESKTYLDKYRARIKTLERFMTEFKCDKSRLSGPDAEKWTSLIYSCISYRNQYKGLNGIYNDLNSNFEKIPRKIMMGKAYSKEYINEVHKVMCESNAVYRQIESELNLRINLIKEMKKLLIQNESDNEL